MVADWITYDAFVDRVRQLHHDGFSGLVTGMSNQQHAFKIGFHRGDIVLLTYRIKKGMAALELLLQMQQAKITEYPTSDGPQGFEGMPDTQTVLSQLTTGTLDDTTVTEFTEIPELRDSDPTFTENIDAVLRRNIETAAVHHFGPIGAMVCDELLEGYRGDLRTAVLAIAREVGASESDALKFFESISVN